MTEQDEEDEPERERFACRLCAGEDLLPGETHECAYAGHEAMPEQAERELLEALAAAPLDTWHGPSSPWARDPFQVGGWTVLVFFDGVDFGCWDYIESATSPAGVTYTAWPRPGELALPMSIAHWQPPKMGPIEDVVRAFGRIADKFRALTRQITGGR